MFATFWEHMSLLKKLYDTSLEPVCLRHGLARMELDILLYLANNPLFDTAKDMVERRRMAKSHVSTAVRELEERGYLERIFRPGNRKTAHLSLLPAAEQVVLEGREAQRAFAAAILRDFTAGEREYMEKMMERIAGNAREAIKEAREHVC